MSVIAANLWNVFTRLGNDGMHHEAVMSRPLLQSCIARLSRHARQGIVTIYTAASEKAREIYRAISAFLSKVAAASQFGVAVGHGTAAAPHNGLCIPGIRHDPAAVPARHRRPDDHTANLTRQSNGIAASSPRQPWLTG